MKIICLLMSFALALCCFSGCSKNKPVKVEKSGETKTEATTVEISTEHREYVEKAIEEMKKCQKGLHAGMSEDELYLEIKNTRLITIKDNIDEDKDIYGIFKDVECVVEFMVINNSYDAAPYYFHFNDSYAIYKDGSVKAHNAFNLYRNRTYSTNFSGIIDEIYDFGGAFDMVCDLK